MAQVTFTSIGYNHPSWAAEQLTPEKLLPGGARLIASVFPKVDSQTLTLAAGAVTAGSNKTLTLTAALKYPIPVGYILDFGAGEIFTLTTPAAAGATTLVGTLAADVEGGESITFAGVATTVRIESGILVGRTFAERAAGTGYGLPDTTTPDDELFLVAFEVSDASINPDVTLVRHGTLIYEDKLPGWAGLSAGAKAAIRSRYQCVTAA